MTTKILAHIPINYLTLRFSGNVAYGKNATQGVNTYKDAVATLAVDGNHNPDFKGGSCAHSIDNSGAPYDPAWWQVDLGATYVVLAVNITNRDQCLSEFSKLYVCIYYQPPI